MKSMRYTLIFTALTVLTVMFFSIMPLSGEEELYDNVIRLHVIAESDSDADQELKLKVRDAVLDEIDGFISGAETVGEAQELILKNLPGIENAAKAALLENGSMCGAFAKLSRESYPTREYEALRLPAGEYMSLQIKIGSANGKNWWCVVFPALCRSSAKAETELQKTGFSSSQIEIITNNENPKYILKFKILEVIQSIFNNR